MSNVEIKRREYSRLFENVPVTHAQLKEYFTVYADAIQKPRESQQFKTLRKRLKQIDTNGVINNELNRYFNIYDRAENLERAINNEANIIHADDRLTPDRFASRTFPTKETYTYTNRDEQN